MVFGQLVDSVPIFGSQRRSYILIGAVFTACGMLTLAGAAGGWIAFGQANHLYIFGAMLIVTGTVIQDVVADAMSTEVVSRVDPEWNCSPGGRDPSRTGHGSSPGPPCTGHRNPFGRRTIRMASSSFRPRDRLFVRPHHSRYLGLRRAVDSIGIVRATACGLAHSRRRHWFWSGSPGSRTWRFTVWPRVYLRSFDGGNLCDAVLRHPGTRRKNTALNSVRQRHHLRFPRHALRW